MRTTHSTTSDSPAVAGFPKHFLWGAATAAHQIEGGNHNQWTVWELENAKSLAAQAMYQLEDFHNWKNIQPVVVDPSNYISDKLGDHYHHYQEDFQFLSSMHMNSYRFSVEWSRLEPQEGAWDLDAVNHYKDYVKDLKARGIEPIITLFHFTLPVWFVEKGGFEKRSNVHYFVRFAERILHELGANIKYIITINEPTVYVTQSYLNQMWPPALSRPFLARKVAHNLVVAHHYVARSIHKMNRRCKVSIAKNTSYFYPGDDAWLSKISAEIMQWINDRELRRYIRSCDFIGVNYYFTNRVYGYRVHNPNERLSDLHWDLQPGDLEYVLERLYRKYKLPLMVTENGLADADDIHRKWWLQETIGALQRALKNGIPVIGYLHWSLLDNFEWAYGRWPRFGLVEVDYKTGERHLRTSALWYGRVIKKLRGL